MDTRKIFSSDGIRGSINSFPFKDDIDLVTKSIAQWQFRVTSEPCVLFVFDTRKSSFDYKNKMIHILTSLGIDVVDAGILPTASISYIMRSFRTRFSGGIVITGSHNPITENGIKIFDAAGKKIDTETENEIEKYFSFNTDITSRKTGKIHSDTSLTKYYIDGLLATFSPLKEAHLPKFIVDLSHGAASIASKQIFSNLNCALINTDFNGDNTNSYAGSEYFRYFPEKMVALLRSHQADFGVSFDGDGDRIIIIDKNGNYFNGDTLLGILALDFKNKSVLTDNLVVATRTSNSGLKEFLSQHEIDILLVRNGDRFISEKLTERNLKLGGESTGNIIINDGFWNTGDSIRTTSFLLNFIATNGKNSLSEAHQKFNNWSQVNISIPLNSQTNMVITEAPKFSEIIKRIKQSIPDISAFECRPASTEPVYRIMIEAQKTSTYRLAELGHSLALEIQKYFKSNNKEITFFDCANGGFINLLK